MTSQPKLAGAALLMFGLTVVGAAAPSSAQSLPSGPVASQDDPATLKGATHKKERVGTKSAGAAKKKSEAKTGDGGKEAAKAPEPWMAVDPSRAAHAAGDAPIPAEPKSVVSHYGTNEPLEIGGKWSGSNDTAEKTRVENYNAGAAGTGGEVGLKMHF